MTRVKRLSRAKVKQLDFWPEQKSPAMAFYASTASSASNLPARSVSEDSQIRGTAGAPLGIYGENAVTLMGPNPSDENLGRLAWFSHPTREAMLVEPAWKTVFQQLEYACKGRADD